MRTAPTLGGVVLILSVVSGCLGSGYLAVPANHADTLLPQKPVVIALIDSGINPYHVDFLRKAPLVPSLFRDARTGDSPTPVALTAEGEMPDRLTADRATWDSLLARRLYWFEGTSVLGISFYQWDRNDVTILDDLGHGTQSAGVAASEAPEAILLMVETSLSLCTTAEARQPCSMDPAITEAMQWVAAQPWIDVVSLSFGSPYSLPDPLSSSFALATREAVRSGKLVIAAAGNNIAPETPDPVSGPPWVISVGGYTHAQGGASLLAAKAPDVASNFTALAASHESERGHWWGVGTSVAAPRVAGVLAAAVADARRLLGHPAGEGIVDGALVQAADGRRLTNADFRAALNATARYPNATDWDPTAEPTEDALANAAAASHPLPKEAAVAALGWGYADAATRPLLVERVLAGDLAIPREKADAAHAMAARQMAREAYWRAILP